MFELRRRFTFEAAHRLPHAPPGHKCGRLHGHSFAVEVHLVGSLQTSAGWVRDFADIDEACAPIRAALDHRYLNEIDGLENPTSEHLALWIWERLEGLEGLSAVHVHENCRSGCIYRGPHLP
jgi:6-pyruvoyltetrahydropterin/6-carboxytetrahydropterin synthase